MRISPRSKDLITGVGIGVGIGVLLLGVLAGIILIRFPWVFSSSTVQPVPTPTIVSVPSLTPTGVVLTATLEPSATPPMPTPTITLTPTPAVTTHTVQRDDTLFGIALEYGTTVEAIRAANGLASDSIFPGDVLVIPDSTVAAVSTPIPISDGEAILHIVASEETLWDIAVHYGVTVGAIQSANGLTSDAIQIGDELIIPLGEMVAEQPTSEFSGQAWQPSILEGDLNAGYPLKENTERFILHYQPDSLPAQDLGTVTGMVRTALTHIENTLDVHLEGQFDAYVAGSLFAPPDQALRGRSFSSQRRFFFLYDGTGTPADRQYILTHELTHLTTWNTMGNPASVMLHEGVAVYTGMELVEDKGYIPIGMFCAAYQQAGRLPSVSTSPSFQGHIRDLDTYYAAGCFVQFIIEEYGTSKFATVYHTGDYYSVYEKSLSDLEAEWITIVQAANYSLPFSPDELIYYVSEVAAAYDLLFSSFGGTETQMTAYRELDRARIALLEGRLGDTANHLLIFESILSEA